MNLSDRIAKLELAVAALGAQEFGDVEGHPFHGNQHTGGSGRDPVTAAKRAENARVERTMKEVHGVMAQDRAYRNAKIDALRPGDNARFHVGAGTGAGYSGKVTSITDSEIKLTNGFFSTNTVKPQAFDEKVLPRKEVRDVTVLDGPAVSSTGIDRSALNDEQKAKYDEARAAGRTPEKATEHAIGLSAEEFVGDLPGHPFHGNQYSEGGGVDDKPPAGWSREKQSTFQKQQNIHTFSHGATGIKVGYAPATGWLVMDKRGGTLETVPSSSLPLTRPDGSKIEGRQSARDKAFAAAEKYTEQQQNHEEARAMAKATGQPAVVSRTRAQIHADPYAGS